VGPAPEEQEDKESRWRAVVPGEISQKHVDDIPVKPEGVRYHIYQYSAS